MGSITQRFVLWNHYAQKKLFMANILRLSSSSVMPQGASQAAASHPQPKLATRLQHVDRRNAHPEADNPGPSRSQARAAPRPGDLRNLLIS
jgi:hypothetical protein